MFHLVAISPPFLIGLLMNRCDLPHLNQLNMRTSTGKGSPSETEYTVREGEGRGKMMSHPPCVRRVGTGFNFDRDWHDDLFEVWLKNLVRW